MEKILKIDIPINLHKPHVAIGVAYVPNGCCENNPVIITANRTHDNRINYSCQCACDMWCTNGHPTAGAALKEYEQMTQRKIKEEQTNESY